MILIYFDKNLKSSEENLSNFIKVRKAFYGDEIYGVDTLDKLKVLISLYHKTGEYYYIISSGSGAEELLKQNITIAKELWILLYIVLIKKSICIILAEKYP